MPEMKQRGKPKQLNFAHKNNDNMKVVFLEKEDGGVEWAFTSKFALNLMTNIQLTDIQSRGKVHKNRKNRIIAPTIHFL